MKGKIMKKKLLSFKTIFPAVLVAILMAVLWFTLPNGVKCKTHVEAFAGDVYETRVEIRDGQMVIYDCVLPAEDGNTTVSAEARLDGYELNVTTTHKEASSEILAMGNWAVVYVEMPKNRDVSEVERVNVVINGKNGEKESFTEELTGLTD